MHVFGKKGQKAMNNSITERKTSKSWYYCTRRRNSCMSEHFFSWNWITPFPFYFLRILCIENWNKSYTNYKCFKITKCVKKIHTYKFVVLCIFYNFLRSRNCFLSFSMYFSIFKGIYSVIPSRIPRPTFVISLIQYYNIYIDSEL